VVAALKAAAIPGVGNNVFPNRVKRLWTDHLPAILVYTRSESSRPLTVTNRRSARTLQLAIEARAFATASLDDDLDDLADAIEAVVDGDDEFGLSFVSKSVLAATELAMDEDNGQPIGGIRLTYEVEYFTNGNGG
jgi:DNA-binding NarL/FixJ family response regulator